LRGDLRRQHRRYGIAEQPLPLERLDLAVARRRTAIDHLRGRIAELRAELRRLESEIGGYEIGLEALLRDEIARITARFAEGWSPVPVLGYRLWVIEEGGLQGARVRWTRPSLTAECTSGDPDEVPHSDGRCGRLGCGVYAAMRVGALLSEMGIRPTTRDYVIGLVALTGKVVEHHAGYRAAKADVAAVAALGRSRLVLTDDPTWTAALFADPGTLDHDPASGIVESPRGDVLERIVDYLENQAAGRDPWATVAAAG
jgi:hypothetical protein